MIMHPLSFEIMLFKHIRATLFDPREKSYRRQIKTILNKTNVDRIIAITSPFYVVTAALKAAKCYHTEVVWYQLDPNQSNVTIAYKKRKT